MDMVKFGGPGRAKQTCMMRQCLSPMLPVTAQCVYCHLDGWRQTPVSPQTKQLASVDGPSALMECSVCYEIAHPDCALSQLDGTEDAADAKGIVNEDLPNSWECPSCCRSGKNYDYKVSYEIYSENFNRNCNKFHGFSPVTFEPARSHRRFVESLFPTAQEVLAMLIRREVACPCRSASTMTLCSPANRK